MAEQSRVQVFVSIRLVKIGDMPTISVVIFVRVSVPRHAQLPSRRESPQQTELHEVADISGVTILHCVPLFLPSPQLIAPERRCGKRLVAVNVLMTTTNSNDYGQS
jgi:hypothetical protein